MKVIKYFVFYPIAAGFLLIIYIRNYFFDLGIFAAKKFPCKVISVGNIALGGTGKTPVVAHLVEMLKEKKQTVAIVSRGYKGQYVGDAEKVNISRDHASQFYGDEPTWFARVLGVPVYVGRRRVRAVELALKEADYDIVVADDAFQHRWLYRDKNIALVDAMETSNKIFPLGHLREPFSSLKRADLVFLTKCNLASPENIKNMHQRLEGYGFSFNRNNLFHVDYVLEDLVPFDEKEGELVLESNERVVLLSGLAQPTSFENLVSRQYKVLHHFQYPDHHMWLQKDISQVVQYCQHLDCDHIVITEKDAVKIEDLNFDDMTVWVANLDLKFDPELSCEHII